jgi:hypothetical protein
MARRTKISLHDYRIEIHPAAQPVYQDGLAINGDRLRTVIVTARALDNLVIASLDSDGKFVFSLLADEL